MATTNIRLVQFSLGPNRGAEAKAIADRVVPAIRTRPGCERAEFFADDQTGDYGLVVLWQSPQAADAAASVIAPMLLPALAAANAAPTIRLFTVYEPR